MKQSEFAALMGVSGKTVTIWKQRGWVVLDAAGGVDEATSRANLERFRDAGRAPVTRAGKAEAPRVVLPGETTAKAAERMLAAGSNLTFDEAKRLKENYLALLNQLEYDQKSRLVVAAADVAAIVGAELATVRTKLLAIPSGHAPRIARLKTATEVQDALLEVIVDALSELTADAGSR